MIYTDLEHTARRQMVQGIGRYAREGHRWQPMIPWADLDVWSLPEGMKVDGVIAFPSSRERIDFLLGLQCPVVCVGPHFSEVDLPRVDWDDELAGQMAVISIGGDNVLCPFCDPSLSSVDLPGEQVDYEAAQLLDRLLEKKESAKEIYVPPRRVVARCSSDVLATSDEMVRLALSYIRSHACEPIIVRDVLGAVSLSRRPLELRFKKVTGHTLQKEIWRVRLGRAKELLSETNLSVAEIADRCGFSEPQRMTEVFCRELDTSPSEFRRSHRIHGSSG